MKKVHLIFFVEIYTNLVWYPPIVQTHFQVGSFPSVAIPSWFPGRNSFQILTVLSSLQDAILLPSLAKEMLHTVELWEFIVEKQIQSSSSSYGNKERDNVIENTQFLQANNSEEVSGKKLITLYILILLS